MRTKLLLIPVLILVAGAAFQGAVPAAQPGASVTLEFSRDGLYPFFWMLHPGMVGVVVVGAGTGLGAAERSGVPAVTRAALAAPVSHPSPQPTSGPGSYYWVVTALGVVVAAGVGYQLGRRRLSGLS